VDENPICYNFAIMVDLFRRWFGALPRIFRTRSGVLLENLALRQQLAVLKRQHPKPKHGLLDKLFGVAARRLWSDWKKWLHVVTPETVAGWRRAGFRLCWTILCKARKRVGGGKRISIEIRQLIFQMVAENPTWGAPCIHGKLRMLGFDVSERTISRSMRREPRNPEPANRWRAFLRNHREAIAAMDFFTVLTLTFNLLYCFFIISHDRRCILHFNITRHPTSSWIVQQLRETSPISPFPESSFLITTGSTGYKFPLPFDP
jgi:hypothetical protein